MSTLGLMFDLRRIPPFDRLRAAELLAIGEVCRQVHFKPGETVLAPGPAGHLLVARTGGFCREDGQALPRIVGLAALLNDRPVPWRVLADRTVGAEAVLIPKRHVRTIISECPSLVVGFFESVGQSVSAEV